MRYIFNRKDRDRLDIFQKSLRLEMAIR